MRQQISVVLKTIPIWAWASICVIAVIATFALDSSFAAVIAGFSGVRAYISLK